MASRPGSHRSVEPSVPSHLGLIKHVFGGGDLLPGMILQEQCTGAFNMCMDTLRSCGLSRWAGELCWCQSMLPTRLRERQEVTSGRGGRVCFTSCILIAQQVNFPSLGLEKPSKPVSHEPVFKSHFDLACASSWSPWECWMCLAWPRPARL